MIRRLHEHLRRLARDDESGQAMTEFVLVFPIQLLLTLTILQFAFIAHAHIVVSQAAFMGARAAAVADMTPVNQQDAARRVVARTVGLLTSGEEPDRPTNPNPPGGGELVWYAQGGQRITYGATRQREAYGHLQQVTVHAYPAEGYLACEVEYDYVMTIPVANHFFARPGSGFWFGSRQPGNAESQARGQTVFRVHRVGFCSTPWTRPLQ